MNIFIQKGEEQVGPFTVEAVQRMLSVGSISPTDYAWHEGLTEWQPLNSILPPPPVRNPVSTETFSVPAQRKVKHGAMIGGAVCFALGVGLMFLSMWSFLIYGPLLLVAFILSIVAMSQSRVIGGLALLLLTLIVPPVLAIVLFGTRSAKLASEMNKQSKVEKVAATSAEGDRESPMGQPAKTGQSDVASHPLSSPAPVTSALQPQDHLAATGQPSPVEKPIASDSRQLLTILRATYVGGTVQRDVTQILGGSLRDGRLQFLVGNHTLGGDPAFGKSKTLTVLYRSPMGDFSISAKEGDTLSIPSEKAVLVAAAVQVPAQSDPRTNSPTSGSAHYADSTPVPIPILSGRPEDITTIDGVKHASVTITRIEPDGLVVDMDSGIDKIPFTALPRETQIKYGYDPRKAAQFSNAVRLAAAQRQFVEMSAEAAQEREKQAGATLQAREQAMAENASRASRIHGRVIQVTRDGLLVDASPIVPVASGLGSIGGGGNVYVPPDPNGKGRPKEVYGTFMVVGHPKKGSIADDGAIDVDATEDGTFSYISTIGAQRTVKKYAVIKAFQ